MWCVYTRKCSYIKYRLRIQYTHIYLWAVGFGLVCNRKCAAGSRIFGWIGQQVINNYIWLLRIFGESHNIVCRTETTAISHGPWPKRVESDWQFACRRSLTCGYHNIYICIYFRSFKVDACKTTSPRTTYVSQRGSFGAQQKVECFLNYYYCGGFECRLPFDLGI